MLHAMRQHHIVTYTISLSLITAYLSLLQPIPSVSAQQLTGLIIHGTSGTGTQAKPIENIAPPLLYPTKSLEKKDTQTLTRKPHRLIRTPQNAAIAPVEPSPSSSSYVNSLLTPSPSLQNDNTISQSKEPSSFTRSVGATVPLATMGVAPSSTTTTKSIAPGTAPIEAAPLATAGNGHSSASGHGGAGGRSMSRLVEEMPGILQLTTPSSVPPVPVNSANPAIGASPIALSFTATQGGTNPAPQTLSISNTGGGTLSWSASDNASWLTLSTASGTGNGSVTLTATTGTLPVGTNSGTVTFSGGAGVPPVTVPVSFTVAAAPNVTLNPSSLTYTATQGAANPTNQTVSLTTSGGTSNWTVSDDVSWLTVSPASGSSNSALTASVNTAGLATGTRTGTITVSATGASSKTIAVTLTVNAPMTSSATLTWTPSIDVDLAGYKIYRSTASGTYGAALATVPAGTVTYQATGLTPNTTYFFVVTAYDTAGNESLFSNEVSKSIF